MARSSTDLLTVLLRDVSRSFYLTLRVLPEKVRSQIGVAYLLARTTDTVADTSLASPDTRLRALGSLRDAILNPSQPAPDFSALARCQAVPAERRLLERVAEAMALLARFPGEDQALIRRVLDTITSGQMLDLQRFSGASSHSIVALQTDEDLENYTYRVAGCVGEFWTRLCCARLFTRAALDEPRLLDLGIRFGKGLQLVNILRDLPADLRQGRCYLPVVRLREIGLEPAELLDATAEARLRPLYERYLSLAEAHLAAGWDYTNCLPWSSVRVRLACAWPILIGVRTLALLRRRAILASPEPIRISQGELRRWIVESVVLYPLPRFWRSLHARALRTRV